MKDLQKNLNLLQKIEKDDNFILTDKRGKKISVNQYFASILIQILVNYKGPQRVKQSQDKERE